MQFIYDQNKYCVAQRNPVSIAQKELGFSGCPSLDYSTLDLTHWTFRVKPPEENAKPSDILFVVDTSSSIKEGDVKKAKNFTEEVLRKVEPTLVDGSRFGIITFSSIVCVQPLVDITMESIRRVHKNITRCENDKHETNIRRATLRARELLRVSGQNRHKFMVLISDGDDNANQEVTDKYKEVKTDVNMQLYKTIAVGVGKRINHDQLKNFVSHQEQNVLDVGSYDSLGSFVDKIAKAVEPPGITFIKIDGSLRTQDNECVEKDLRVNPCNNIEEFETTDQETIRTKASPHKCLQFKGADQIIFMDECNPLDLSQRWKLMK